MQKLITGYSLLEFLAKAQEAILEGYRFNFDDNDSVPQKFGNVYEAMMQDSKNLTPQVQLEQAAEPDSIVAPLATIDNWKETEVVSEPTSTKGKKKA